MPTVCLSFYILGDFAVDFFPPSNPPLEKKLELNWTWVFTLLVTVSTLGEGVCF